MFFGFDVFVMSILLKQIYTNNRLLFIRITYTNMFNKRFVCNNASFIIINNALVTAEPSIILTHIMLVHVMSNLFYNHFVLGVQEQKILQ